MRDSRLEFNICFPRRGNVQMVVKHPTLSNGESVASNLKINVIDREITEVIEIERHKYLKIFTVGENYWLGNEEIKNPLLPLQERELFTLDKDDIIYGEHFKQGYKVTNYCRAASKESMSIETGTRHFHLSEWDTREEDESICANFIFDLYDKERRTQMKCTEKGQDVVCDARIVHRRLSSSSPSK